MTEDPVSEIPSGFWTRRRFAITTPWYHGWNVIAVGILIQAITIGLLTYSLTFWVAPLQAAFGASIGTIMLAASLSHVALAAISPFCGRILDSNAVRPLVIGGIVVFAAGYFLISISAAIWQVILVYSTLLPLGASFAGPLPAQVATARWFAEKRGMALGITALGSSIGGFVFPPVVAALVGSLGWRASHVVLGALIIALSLPIVWLFMREPAEDTQAGEPEHRATHASAAVKFPEWTIPQLLRSKTLWIIILSFVPMLTVYLSFKFNLAPIAEASGIAAQKASYIMAISAAFSICGKLFFGFLADRVEHRFLIWTAAAFLLISLLLPQISTSYVAVMLSFAMLGLAGGGFLPLMGAIGASRFGPRSLGRVIGLMGPLNMIGSFGPSVFAYLVASFGSYGPAFRILMAVVVLTLAAASFLGPAVPESPAKGGKLSVRNP